MNELDAPATPEEQAAARRLAEALDGRAEANDAELAAARLLQTLGAAERRDEVADRRARRLRAALVREASGRRRLPALRHLAAAGILLFAAGVTSHLATRHRAPHDAADLATREAEARAAVARLMSAAESARPRLGAVTDNLREARLERLWLSRFERVLHTSDSGAAARPSPTPGGPES